MENENTQKQITTEKTETVKKISTNIHSINMAYAIETKAQTEKRIWQQRTKDAKFLFLKYWRISRGVISATCDKAKIDRGTYYDWTTEGNQLYDPDFVKQLEEVTSHRNKDIEDLLIGKATIERNMRAITYYLDRQHPGYKPKVISEIVTGDRTLEDLLDEDSDKKINQEINGNDTTKTIGENAFKQGTDRKIIVDQKQARPASPVQIKPGARVVLEKKNPQKPDTQSPARGNKQNN